MYYPKNHSGVWCTVSYRLLRGRVKFADYWGERVVSVSADLLPSDDGCGQMDITSPSGEPDWIYAAHSDHYKTSNRHGVLVTSDIRR
jgi:hypothetical protein